MAVTLIKALRKNSNWETVTKNQIVDGSEP